jgi:ParB-like nuclease domain
LPTKAKPQPPDRQPPAPDVAIHLDARVVPIGDLYANPWNVNAMDERGYEATRESIRDGGFLDPVTVRAHPTREGKWQIIDGEHRWKAAKDEGLKAISINVLALPDDEQAKKLSLILNQHGQADKLSLAKLIKGLAAKLGPEARRGLAYSEEEFEELISLAAATWNKYETPEPPSDGEWVMLSFRVPKAAEAVIEDAITKAADSGESHDRGVALERICADYLAGPGDPPEETPP